MDGLKTWKALNSWLATNEARANKLRGFGEPYAGRWDAFVKAKFQALTNTAGK